MTATRIDHALVLAAGQGSRLLPLTADTPKCLLDLAGRSMLEWQLRGLAAAGIGNVTVVTGFKPDQVEAAIERVAPRGLSVRTLFNPFFKVADNLASCWMARDALRPGSLILNGDTLFEPAIARRLLDAPAAPITVTIDKKPVYDADDMKVELGIGDESERLRSIGKTLPPERTHGESIGFLRFDAEGAGRFVDEIERTMRTPQGTGLWYLSAIDKLAKAGVDVRVASIEGMAWSELDFPADLDACREVAATLRD